MGIPPWIGDALRVEYSFQRGNPTLEVVNITAMSEPSQFHQNKCVTDLLGISFFVTGSKPVHDVPALSQFAQLGSL